jgi:hypothetical protein
MADQHTPSGIPLEVTSPEQTVEESLPRIKQKAPASRQVQALEHDEMPETTTAIAVVESSGDDDELDEIIERVLEVVRARREGRPVPKRRSADALGDVPVAANPAEGGSNKTLIYAGVGIGVVALAGGLWWYFKKND